VFWLDHGRCTPPSRFVIRHAGVAAGFVGAIQRVGFGCTLLVGVKFCEHNLLAQDPASREASRQLDGSCEIL
jgi:hypothetical protein